LIYAFFTPFILIYLTPCVPLSSKERGRVVVEGASPFKLPKHNYSN